MLHLFQSLLGCLKRSGWLVGNTDTSTRLYETSGFIPRKESQLTVSVKVVDAVIDETTESFALSVTV